MTFITKKHLSRRTFLRGVGVTLALPLLDSMIPARRRCAQTAATPKTRFALHLRPARRDHGQVDAGDRGPGFEFTEILQAARAVPRPHQRHQRPGASDVAGAGGAESAGANHTRSAAVFLSGAVAEARRAGAPRHHGRSGRGAADRPGHAAAVARADRSRKPVLALRGGFSCAYREHDLLAGADVAAADAEQPAGGVRAAVRRRQHRRRAPRAAAGVAQPARFGARRRSRRCSSKLPPAIARRLDQYLDDVREIERRIQRAEKQLPTT